MSNFKQLQSTVKINTANLLSVKKKVLDTPVNSQTQCAQIKNVRNLLVKKITLNYLINR